MMDGPCDGGGGISDEAVQDWLYLLEEDDTANFSPQKRELSQSSGRHFNSSMTRDEAEIS